jgi:hypothetical protein
MEEDFQHFLSYSGLSSESPETIEKLHRAFEAAWEPSKKDLLKNISEEYNEAIGSGLSPDDAFSCAMDAVQAL